MSKKAKPFEKLMLIMLSGNKVTKEEIGAQFEARLMYRLSTYIYAIKKYGGGIVKVEKDGRKVSSYQLANIDECKQYLSKVGLLSVKPAVESLNDLTAEQVTEQVTEQVA
jgi:hypothetical protein